MKIYYETPLGRLWHGDCVEGMEHIRGVDLILTDPPYGLGIAANPFRQKFDKKEWDNSVPDKCVFDMIFTSSREQIIWGGNFFNLPPTQGFLIWDKVQPEGFSSSMIEYAWISKQQPAKMFKKRVTTYKKSHPTQKPVDLMIWCIGFYPEAGLVLDPFLGSGTTAIACERLNRRWIGIEIEEKYCEIAAKRIEAERKQQKLF